MVELESHKILGSTQASWEVEIKFEDQPLRLVWDTELQGNREPEIVDWFVCI